MSLIATIIRRPVGSLVACACLTALGVIAAGDIPINLYPQSRFPALTITTILSEADPEEIEILITRKLEEALSDLPGLKKISSVSRQGESEVVLEFHLGQNITIAAVEVRGKIRRLWPSFPRDTRFPVINHFNPADDPLAVLGVTGDLSVADLTHWVEKTLKPQLTRINGVAGVQVAGGSETEIIVECDVGRLNALGLTFDNVVEAIGKGHATLPAGFLNMEGKRVAIRTTGELDTIEKIAAQPLVVSEGGGAVTVGDVAKVTLDAKEPKELTHLNGKPLVSVAVFRTSDADLRHLWTSVKARIDEMRHSMPADVNVDVVYSQAEFLEESLQRLRIIMALGAVVAGIALFLFLGTLSSTLIIMTAIPFSLLTALLLMYLVGIPLDMLSLSGLSLAVGMVVDSGIVVIESITRRIRGGSVEEDAIVKGTQEVGVPVLFSTLTTVMVFLPLVFVSLRVRTFFLGLTWTVCLSLIASLVAALVLVPVLFTYFGGHGRARRFELERALPYPGLYDRILPLLVRHPAVVVLSTITFLAVAGLATTRLSFSSGIGRTEQGFKVSIVMEPGSSAERSAKEAHLVEDVVLQFPGVRRVHTRSFSNQSQIMVTFQKGTRPEAISRQMRDLKVKLGSTIKSQFDVLPLDSGGDTRSLSVYLTGPNMDRLMALLQPLHGQLSKIPGVQAVILQQANPVPELAFEVKHEVLGSSGVRALDLAGDLRSRLTGPVAARVTRDEKETLVRVRAQKKPEEGLKILDHAFLYGEHRQRVPFAQLAEPVLKLGAAEIHHNARKRVMRASVVFGPREDPLTIAQRVREALARIELPAEYYFSLGEEAESILKTRVEMVKAAAIALLLIYLVLVAATESFLQPLVIITAAPFAVGGVVLALMLLGYPVNLPVYLGFIILLGLVANVNIVLVYAINDSLRTGATPEDAVTAGARRRLRPILMTTLTTVGAALPMLLDRGTGSSTWGPFSLALVAGLTSASLFSLVLTPAAYVAILRLSRRVRGRIDSAVPTEAS
ncbi:MAG: efflux RND transporter permease subunit [Desulfomonile sp.]|nr:efflux RND transporter permease subunit [Desulfomonile sp.]